MHHHFHPRGRNRDHLSHHMGTERLSPEGVDDCMMLSERCRQILEISFSYRYFEAIVYCVMMVPYFAGFNQGGGGSFGFNLIFSNTPGFSKYPCWPNFPAFFSSTTVGFCSRCICLSFIIYLYCLSFGNYLIGVYTLPAPLSLCNMYNMIVLSCFFLKKIQVSISFVQ